MKKLVTELLVFQIIQWGVFLFCDFLQETHHSAAADNLLYYGAMMFLPVLLFLILCLREKNTREEQGFSAMVPHQAARLAVWIGMNAAAFAVLYPLAAYRIIPQHSGGWEWFLNGVEYMFTPLISSAAAVAITFIRFCAWFILRKYRETHPQS